jgi:hypothetical protein
LRGDGDEVGTQGAYFRKFQLQRPQLYVAVWSPVPPIIGEDERPLPEELSRGNDRTVLVRKCEGRGGVTSLETTPCQPRLFESFRF